MALDTMRDGAVRSTITRRDLSDCLQRALTRLGLQAKELAFYWSCNHAYVSRVLSNQDPLSDARLAQLPEDVQRATLEEWASDLGVTVGRKAELGKALSALAALADVELPAKAERMAKAELPPSKQRRMA